MLICQDRGVNDLHMFQLIPLPPHYLLLQENLEWCRLTQAVLEKRPLNGRSSSSSIIWYASDLDTNRKRLETFEMWIWKRMERGSWNDNMTNVDVLQIVNETRNRKHH